MLRNIVMQNSLNEGKYICIDQISPKMPQFTNHNNNINKSNSNNNNLHKFNIKNNIYLKMHQLLLY